MVPASVAADMLSIPLRRVKWLQRNGWLAGTWNGSGHNARLLISTDSLRRYSEDPPPVVPWQSDGGMSHETRDAHLRRLRAAARGLGGDQLVPALRDGARGTGNGD